MLLDFVWLRGRHLLHPPHRAGGEAPANFQEPVEQPQSISLSSRPKGVCMAGACSPMCDERLFFLTPGGFGSYSADPFTLVTTHLTTLGEEAQCSSQGHSGER